MNRNADLNFGNKVSYFRIKFLTYTFLIIYILLSARYLYIVCKSQYKFSNLNTRESAFRQDILDRNGIVLATNIPSYAAFINPQKVNDKKEVAKQIHAVLKGEMQYADILKKISSNDKKFVWIKRNLSPEIMETLNRIGIQSLDFEKENLRFYPYGNVFSHIVGYVGVDNTGLSGLERYFNAELTGKNNQPIRTTLDSDIQKIVHEELTSAAQSFKAVAGSCIVADPTNGEILAIVNYPDFNPHIPAISKKESLFPVASLGRYEIGSVFKSIVMAIALDVGTTKLGDWYNLDSFTINNFTIKDYRPNPGWHSVGEIFMHSSNVGMSHIMFEIGQKNFEHYIRKLGLYDNIKVEIPEKSESSIPQSSSVWSELTLATMSYGYGISITPLHFVQAMLPVVNGGRFYPLTLTRQENPEYTQVFKDTTSIQMNKLLRLCVNKGTGKRANVDGYLVGGKTGTAYKLNRNKKYDKNSRISSFIAIAPSINPMYLIYIMLDDPKGNKSTFGNAGSGFTTAPIAQSIISRTMAIKGISPIDHNDPNIEDMVDIEIIESD